MTSRFELSEAESVEQFERVSKTLLEHNPSQGVNYWAGSPYPTMLLWAGRLYDFLRVLEEIVGYPLARRHSYLVGHRSGWDGAEVSRALLTDASAPEVRASLLATGSRILAGAGWGRSAVEHDPSKETVVWDFSQGTAIGLAAKMDGVRENPACAFIAGFVAGWTNRSLETETEFQEVECVARGEPRCLFASRGFSARVP